MSVYTIIITYVITINLIAFFLMGTRQMESPEKGLADSGSYLVSVCHLWWQHRQYSRYVSLPPQDPPLVFFIWIATDLMCAASAHLSDLAFPC